VKKQSYRHGLAVRRSPTSKDKNPETEESKAFGAVTKRQLVKTQQTEKS
jgi:hypothetical protein